MTCVYISSVVFTDELSAPLLLAVCQLILPSRELFSDRILIFAHAWGVDILIASEILVNPTFVLILRPLCLPQISPYVILVIL